MLPVVQNTVLCAVSYNILVTDTHPAHSVVTFQQSYMDHTKGGFLWSRMNWLILHCPLQKAKLCNTSRTKCVP